jgi:hypothetical protein
MGLRDDVDTVAATYRQLWAEAHALLRAYREGGRIAPARLWNLLVVHHLPLRPPDYCRLLRDQLVWYRGGIERLRAALEQVPIGDARPEVRP